MVTLLEMMLKEIKIMNHRCSGSSNTMSGWIDDMKFWNGIDTNGDL